MLMGKFSCQTEVQECPEGQNPGGSQADTKLELEIIWKERWEIEVRADKSNNDIFCLKNSFLFDRL